MKPILRAYLLGVAAPASAVALLLLMFPAAPAVDPLLAVILVGLAIAAANYQVMVTPRYKADATPAIDFAIVLLFPAAAAVALVGAGRLAAEMILTRRRNPVTGTARRAPIDVVFNTSQLMLAAAAGAIIFRGVTAGRADEITVVVGGAAAATAMYVINTALVVIAAAIHNHRRPLDVFAEAAAGDLKQTGALYVAGMLLAVIAARSPWLAVVMMVPIGGVQLSLKRSMQLRQQTIAAVESMADLVDRRDPYTFQHSRSVAGHAVRTARALNLPESEIELIGLAARVHDLGKIAVPDSVLHKEGRLTDEEFALMKKHPDDGAEILAKFPDYRRGRELVLAHHERMDGRGYPRGLAGDEIPLGARIIAVADAWDAMTSDRPYRKALSQDVALGELMRGRSTQWDAKVVDAFAASLPGAEPVEVERHAGLAAPLLRSLGAVAGALTSIP
jgi:HD-GYP domain-containing protein (c-di-GMP phosphodiesterase class II)